MGLVTIMPQLHRRAFWREKPRAQCEISGEQQIENLHRDPEPVAHFLRYSGVSFY
jgi:hypothetical protein